MRKTVTVLWLAALCSGPGALAGTIEASDTANVSQGIGFYPGGLGGIYLTINWGSSNAEVGLIQFDLSSETGATISSAILGVYQDMNSAYSEFGVFRNTSPWVGITNSWATLPTTDPTPAATLTISDLNQAVWRSFDVTSLVQGWLDGTYPNYGVSFERLDQANPVLYFTSSDGGSVGEPFFAPKLDLTEAAAGAAAPEPSSILLLCSGLLAALLASRRMRSGSIRGSGGSVSPQASV